MSRIAACFAELKAEGRQALIPYVTAGDPHPDNTVALMHALVEGGADIIELGVPFSDPMADGPVIQRASERALKHKVSLHDVFAMVKAFRQDNTKTAVVLMGYLNPVEVMGYDVFAKAASEAGVDGVLTVDLPPEEGDEFVPIMKMAGLDPIFLLAPTSTDERIEAVKRVASGFVYYVSIKGVTGSAGLNVAEVANMLGRIRSKIDLPIGVGFGIKDAETAAAVATVADAVVVGSSLVRKIESLQDQSDRIASELTAMLADMRNAMDS